MSLTALRAIRRGRGAWMRGDLEAALADLEAALETAPHALEALYPMARVLAESDQRDRALAVLDQAGTLDESGYVGRVFSAMLHYDYGEWEEAREAIAGFDRNVLARSIDALLDFETKEAETLVLNRGALWISETLGRLLAALEARLFARGQTAVNAFHEELFTEGGSPSVSAGTDQSRESGENASSEPSSAATPRPEAEKPDPERFEADREWWAALEAAFRARDHLRVTRLYRRKEVPEKWRDVVSGVLNGTSLLAVGETKRALEASRTVVRQHPTAAWAHFLVGLTNTGLGDRRHALYAFVRAAQRSDTEMHHTMMELARSLKVSIEFAD